MFEGQQVTSQSAGCSLAGSICRLAWLRGSRRRRLVCAPGLAAPTGIFLRSASLTTATSALSLSSITSWHAVWNCVKAFRSRPNTYAHVTSSWAVRSFYLPTARRMLLDPIREEIASKRRARGNVRQAVLARTCSAAASAMVGLISAVSSSLYSPSFVRYARDFRLANSHVSSTAAPHLTRQTRGGG